MKRVFFKLGLLVLLANLYGCSMYFPQYITNDQCALDQTLVTQALDDSLDKIKYPAEIADKKIFLEVGDLESKSSSYVRAELTAKIVNKGGIVIDDPAQADLKVVGIVKTAGINLYDSGGGLFSYILFNNLFYSKSRVGYAGIKVLAYDLKTSKLIFKEEAFDKKRWYQWSMFFSIIGPITGTDLRGVNF